MSLRLVEGGERGLPAKAASLALQWLRWSAGFGYRRGQKYGTGATPGESSFFLRRLTFFEPRSYTARAASLDRLR